jgi:hypothetical protein
VFWPDDITLSEQSWGDTPAWDRGPTWGALVAAARPAIRALLLLGYAVDAIGLGFGKGISLDGEWQLLALETLALVPGPDLSPDKQAEGPTLWLQASPLTDSATDLDPQPPADGDPADDMDDIDLLVDTYAIEFDAGLFGSDDYTADGTVPAAITSAVVAVAIRAVDLLGQRLPSKGAWQDAVAAGGGLPRQANGGLVWILDPHYWDGVGPDALAEQVHVVEELLEAREKFLLGQVFDDRDEHRAGSGPGPAHLFFLLGRELFWPGKANIRFWTALLAQLQARGEAHRLWERERARFSDPEAPNWLDVLGELLARGVVGIFGLFTPLDPPLPLTPFDPNGDALATTEVTLTVWGATAITLRRQTVFADQPNPGVMGSVAWDYVPGNEQRKPTVLLVAGRGIAIEHHIDDLDSRPWALEIYRVQDDAVVQRLGAQVDTVALLSTAWVEPQARECVAADDVFTEPSDAAQILAQPTPTGVRLVYPVAESTIPTPFGDISSAVVPSVVELAVDPLSGTAAYALDAHYFTGLHLDVPAGELFNGGVQVSVWTTGEVTITSYDSHNQSAAAGDPSGVSRTVETGHLFVAEFWQVEVTGQPGGEGPDPRTGPRSLTTAAEPPAALGHPLPRPWSVELPVTGWEQLFPTSFWQQVLAEMWRGLVLQGIQDLFEVGRDDPFADDAVPHLAYDSSTRQAPWHDRFTGTDLVLTPAAHAHDDFGAMDSLFFTLADAGVGFIPFVGDAVEVGELLYAWQTGRDRWGRPVSNWQLAGMFAGAALPFVSVPVLHGMSEAAAQLLERLPDGVVLRARSLASRFLDYATEDAEAAMRQPGVLERAGLASASRADRQASQELMETVANDAATSGSAASRFGQHLVLETSDGWLTVDDLLTDGGDAFTVNALQTAYTRSLRDNPGVDAVTWIVGDG